MIKLPFAVTTAFLVLIASARAHAGSQAVECMSKGKNINLSTKNAEIEIGYDDKKTGKRASFKYPLSLQPGYRVKSLANEKVITVIPTSNKKILSNKQSHLHIVHKDGTSCDGREMWDKKYLQRFLLTAPNGAPLRQLHEKTIEGKTEEDYVLVEMECRDSGVTSPGGCRPLDDEDTVTEVKDN